MSVIAVLRLLGNQLTVVYNSINDPLLLKMGFLDHFELFFGLDNRFLRLFYLFSDYLQYVPRLETQLS